MRFVRCEITDASVWSKCVVGINGFAHRIGSGGIVYKYLTEPQLMFEDAVDALCNGIVVGTARLKSC